MATSCEKERCSTRIVSGPDLPIKVARSILDVGALVHYLPPYLPDFAPIENAFSKVKQLLLSADNSEDMHDDLETLVLAAFTQITPSDCQHWIFDTGIYMYLKTKRI